MDTASTSKSPHIPLLSKISVFITILLTLVLFAVPHLFSIEKESLIMEIIHDIRIALIVAIVLFFVDVYFRAKQERKNIDEYIKRVHQSVFEKTFAKFCPPGFFGAIKSLMARSNFIRTYGKIYLHIYLNEEGDGFKMIKLIREYGVKNCDVKSRKYKIKHSYTPDGIQAKNTLDVMILKGEETVMTKEEELGSHPETKNFSHEVKIHSGEEVRFTLESTTVYKEKRDYIMENILLSDPTERLELSIESKSGEIEDIFEDIKVGCISDNEMNRDMQIADKNNQKYISKTCFLPYQGVNIILSLKK